MYPEFSPTTQRGLGLIAALFLIVVVALLVAGILSLVRTSGQSFAQNVKAQRALMAAESGAQLSLNRLYAPLGVGGCNNTTWNFTQPGLENCVAVVTCSAENVSSDIYYTLESHGHCESGSEIAERRVILRSKP